MVTQPNHSYTAFLYPDLTRITADDFYRQYQSLMFSAAYKCGYDYYTAEQAIDDVLIRIFCLRKCSYDPRRGTIISYLYGAIAKACHNQKRRDQRCQFCPEEELVALCDLTESTHCSLERQLRRAEMERMMRTAMLQLGKEMASAKTQAVFELAVVEQERPREVARLLNVTPTFVYQVKQTWKRRFQELLDRIDRNAC